ncbi:MAG: LacI family transcriptional regulator [Bacteroidales bacterium]|nr:LacI family transcriptional regulator [Bacteroidales bacterium]
MNRGNITIKDIARELKISPSTVSRALNDHPDISPETKKTVNSLAEKWNYVPNPIALSLKGGSTKTIGIIIPEIIHYFFSTVVSGAEDYANEQGYNVMICQSNEKYENEIKSVQTLLNSRVDGILVSVSKRTRNMKHFHTIIKKGVPLVFFDRICNEIDTDRVIVDDIEGAYMAVKHLILEGRKNIIHLSGPPTLQISKDRIEGYIRALNEFSIQVNEDNIIKCDEIEEVDLIVPGILKKSHKFDAFFCVNDFTAAQAMKILKNHGLKIPDDIAIVGFTNGQLARLTDPGLTSVDQHGYEMGQESARLMIERIRDKNKPTQTMVIKTDLAVRNSSSAKA